MELLHRQKHRLIDGTIIKQLYPEQGLVLMSRSDLGAAEGHVRRSEPNQGLYSDTKI